MLSVQTYHDGEIMMCPRFRLKERLLNENIWYCWTCNKDLVQSKYGSSMGEMNGNTEVSTCSKGRLLGMPFTLRWAGWTSVLALIVPVETVLGPCLCSRLIFCHRTNPLITLSNKPGAKTSSLHPCWHWGSWNLDTHLLNPEMSWIKAAETTQAILISGLREH